MTSSNLVGCKTGRSEGARVLRNLAGVNAELAIGIRDADAVAQQAAGCYELAPSIRLRGRIATIARNRLADVEARRMRFSPPCWRAAASPTRAKDDWAIGPSNEAGVGWRLHNEYD